MFNKQLYVQIKLKPKIKYFFTQYFQNILNFFTL